MIRGSTYSALLHLSILAIILFGIPGLTLILPKWEKKEEMTVPVVAMEEQEAKTLAEGPLASLQKNALPVEADVQDIKKANGPADAKPEKPAQEAAKAVQPPPVQEKSSLIGTLSTVTDADPQSDEQAPESATTKPTKEVEKPQAAIAEDQAATKPSPVPPQEQAPLSPQNRPKVPPTKPEAEKAEWVSPVIDEMVETLPRLKTIREELKNATGEEKFNPAIAKTAERMQKMSEEGYAHAQFSLAEMYLTGEGVKKDQAKAVELLNRAAISGYLPAQLALGMMAAEGRGMERNLAEGHSWLSIAAAQGTKAAGTALARLEKKMGTKDVIEAHKRSLQLHKVLVIIHGSDLKKSSKSELSERLRIAAALGDVESVHVLLAQGADADDPDQDGRTAVIEAAWRGYPRIVKSLIDNGANLNATDETGKTAVMWAAINGHAPVITNLLAARAPLDERDKEGLSALMRAAWNGHADAVRALLAAKANTGLVDKKGLRAIDYARRSNNRMTVQLLSR